MKKAIVGVAIGLLIVAMIITFGQVFTVRYIGVEFENSVSAANKQEILSLANIDSNTNIFVLDENALKQRIEKAYPDNVIRVTDIVRTFPDKVTIKVSERIAIYKIAANKDSESGYVAVDRNFQRNTIYSEEELENMMLVDVKGFVVEDSFVTEECYLLRDIANAFLAYTGADGNAIPEEGLPYLVKEVTFSDTSVNVMLRTDDATIVIDKSDDVSAKEQVRQLFGEYLATNAQNRSGKVFSL